MHRSLLEPDVFELFLKPGEVVEVRSLGLVGTSPLWGRAFARGVVARISFSVIFLKAKFWLRRHLGADRI
jgi:hypothetical protein